VNAGRGIGALVAIALALRTGIGDDAPPPVNAGTDSAVDLRAPPQREGFEFVVFGDRTGGKPEGVRVLDRAVEMTNRLDPDFVVTVGDLVQGYTGADAWLRQAEEYKTAMGRLKAPWYPVVGNHDVYGGRENPAGNAALYKKHFGPLYYSFDHRWAHVVCLFSDEALSFADPARDQNMSPEQMEWLRRDLAATKAEQVFVFLHHPRWLYEGCNWPEVHKMLAADGRVRAVVCGHLHTYRDDGLKDGIHYYAIAMTGAEPPGRTPAVAAVQHVAHVKARRDRFTIALLPVGAVQASDSVLGTEVDAMTDLLRGEWLGVDGTPAIAFAAGRQSAFAVVVRNPTDRALPFTLEVEPEEGWTLEAEKTSGTAAAGAEVKIPVSARAPAFTQKRPALTVKAAVTYALASGLKERIDTSVSVPVRLVGVARDRTTVNKALVLDGSSAVRVPLSRAETVFAQFTLECWAKGRPSPRSMSVVSKVQSSGFGIQWNDAARKRDSPTGFVHLPRMPGTKKAGYVWVGGKEPATADRWTHLALVHDGTKARFYVDGKLADEQDAGGAVTTNDYPLYVGADPSASGIERPFTGSIDEVRLSRAARYTADFKPAKTFERDDDCVVLLHFDTMDQGVLVDDSGRDNHGWPVGAPNLEETRR